MWWRKLGRQIRRRQQYVRRRVDTRLVSVFLVLVPLLFLSYAAFVSPLFSLVDITVEFTSSEGHDLEREGIEQGVKKRVLGKNILLLSTKELSFLEEELSYREVKIAKKLPHSLVVAVSRRVPLAVVSDQRGRLFLVDETGTIFSSQRQEGLPVINLPEQSLSLGQEISSEGVAFVLSLLSALSDDGFLVGWVELTGGLRLKVAAGPEVLLGAEADTGPALLAILKNYRAQGVLLKKVDLRAKNPVLEYE